MLNPPCDSPGMICFSSKVSAKLSWGASSRIEMGLGLKLQMWNDLLWVDRRKIVPISMMTGPTGIFLSS